MNFDKQVVVITGAGNGVGKAYALEFAARGAMVVVNDCGCSLNGDGRSKEAADSTVQLIQKNGGQAIADYNSVENAETIVNQVVEKFGRIDILINNAAIIQDSSFLKMTESSWDAVYRTCLLGTFRMTKQVWPIMRRQKYGRIINTVSAAGLYGNFGQANYAAMKMGIFGLSQVLHQEGLKYNIQVNTVSPIAGTRLTRTVLPDDLISALKPEYNAPFVVYLCHNSCTESGSIFEMGGGWIGKLRYQRSEGAFFELDEEFTAKGVAERWEEITDFSRVSHPRTTQEGFEPVLRTLTHSKDKGRMPTVQRSSVVFERLAASVKEQGPILVKKVNGVIQWNIGHKTVWTVDLAHGNGNVFKGQAEKPDVIFVLSEDHFLQLSSGKLKPQQALISGRMKVRGNMKYAMKVEPLIDLLRDKAKL